MGVFAVGEKDHGVIGDGSQLQLHAGGLCLGQGVLRGLGGDDEQICLAGDQPVIGIVALGVALGESRVAGVVEEQGTEQRRGVGIGGGGAVDDGHVRIKAPGDGRLRGITGQKEKTVVEEFDHFAAQQGLFGSASMVVSMSPFSSGVSPYSIVVTAMLVGVQVAVIVLGPGGDLVPVVKAGFKGCGGQPAQKAGGG